MNKERFFMANKICSSCNKEIPAGANFCASCGAKVGSGNFSAKRPTTGKSHNKEIIIILSVLIIIGAGYFLMRDKPNLVIDQPTTKISGHEDVEGADMTSAMSMLGNLPTDFDALVGMGNQFMDEGNFPVGAECYKRALAIKPELPDVRVDYGACLHGMGLPQRALEEFHNVVDNYPDHNIVHFNIGIVYNELNQTDSAVFYWKKYLELDPTGMAANSATKLIEQYGGK